MKTLTYERIVKQVTKLQKELEGRGIKVNVTLTISLPRILDEEIAELLKRYGYAIKPTKK